MSMDRTHRRVGDDEAVLNADEAAALLRISRNTIYRLVEKGRLPGRKVGREWRFSRQALLAWLGEAPVRQDRPAADEPDSS